EEAMAAFAAAARLERRWAAADALPALPPAAPIEGGRRLLDEWQSKRLLAEHGLVLPAGRLVAPTEAVAAARAIGFPVVAKIARPAIAHKTEAGAVALDLRDERALAAAVTRMAAAARALPGLVVEQLLIERQVTGAVAELIVGVKRDAAFGLALVIGAGGVLVEMVADSATLLLPTTEVAIGEALAGL